MMPSAVDNHGYKFVELWASRFDTSVQATQIQCDEALKDKAPLNATHRDSNGWHTTDEVLNPEVRRNLGLHAIPPQEERVLNFYDARNLGHKQGVYRIQFRSMATASTWAITHEVVGRVRLHENTAGRFFNQPVVVELMPVI